MREPHDFVLLYCARGASKLVTSRSNRVMQSFSPAGCSPANNSGKYLFSGV